MFEGSLANSLLVTMVMEVGAAIAGLQRVNEGATVDNRVAGLIDCLVATGLEATGSWR